MPDTDEILRRFEERAERRPYNPPPPSPPPPPKRPTAPSDDQSRAILRGAARVCETMMHSYPVESREETALFVLVKFTKDMLGE